MQTNKTRSFSERFDMVKRMSDFTEACPRREIDLFICFY